MPGQPGAIRLCEWCGDKIPDHMRRDSAYCSRSHKVQARRARRRAEARGVTTSRAGSPLESYEDGGYPDDEAGSPTVAQRIASTRFQRYLSEQIRTAPVVPVALRDTQRRNPGVVLPAIAEIQARDVPELPRPEPRDESLGARAQASRATNRPRSYERLPAADYPDIATWATLPTTPRSSGSSFGRRTPARYLNG